MKARERFDKILLSCCSRIQEEVASLIGKPFKLGDPQFHERTKEEVFAEPGGRRVLAHIQIDGDLQGAGCLMVGIKDAIQIGGALIMLPESELATVSAEEQYSEELEDSFGEVANIICGAITVTFEEQYPKNVRFIRTNQEVVVPVKVVAESELPIVDGRYYLMTAAMQLDNRNLGSLEVLFPGLLFGLVAEPAKGKVEVVAEEVQAPPVAPPQETPAPVGTIPRPAGEPATSEEAGILERPAAAEPASPAAPPPRDLGRQKKLVDQLLTNSMARMCEEVSALLGGTLQVVPTEHTALTKAGFLDQAGGKQIMARMDIRGQGQGEAFLFVEVKTAVYLGGSLIMLPEGELETTVRNEDFGDDAADAYGEVTNIIAGVYTAVFEEQYRTKLGFVKTAMEPVTPVKVDPETDEVLPNQPYYLSAGEIEYNGKALGRLQLLLPARVLELDGLLRPAEAPVAGTPTDAVQAPPVAPPQETPAPVGTIPRPAGEAAASEEVGILKRPAAADPASQQAPAGPDLGRQKKLVDQLLTNSMARMCEEVSALLGGTLQVVPTEHTALTKAGFLDQAGGKQIMARMDIRGQGLGEAFLFVEVKTAVYLGGSLIMLPEGELEATVRNEDFGDDAADAYGEVTNIIAGVYTAVFEEQYRTKLGFVKTAMEPVTPVKVDPETDEVLPNQPYYLSAGEIEYNGKALGRLQLLLPARVLELDGLLRPSEAPAAERPSNAPSAEPVRLQEKPVETSDILIFTDNGAEGNRIAASLQQLGYVPRILHFKDSVGNLLTPRIQMVFLVMQEVSEQGFGVAIKLSSSGLRVPLVAAGPAWTRTLVLKAVKYGACDILITPAEPADIREKIEGHLVRKAA